MSMSQSTTQEKHQSSVSTSNNSGQGGVVDESPLQKTMDKNKESLKVKLMLRRPINQLVAQGIMPQLKTSPAFHEQRQKLERAKMGDLLKAKIQQRPDREELVRQHILEADEGHVDPSLAERQRMLKKARLADSLNDQLSHRPGPLELIKKNILHTEEPIERAVKEGVIPFKATSEGQLRKPQHPDHYITFEDDSQSSEGGATSPASVSTSIITTPQQKQQQQQQQPQQQLLLHQQQQPITQTRDVLETAAASAGIVTVALTIPTNAVVVTSPTLQTFAELCSSVVSPLSLGSSTSSLSPLSSVASPPTPLTPRPASMPSPAPGKADKNRKKTKTKIPPKTRTIKFHEYKGPPNAHKNQSLSAASAETSYELLLQQQQLFLQWQLEWQHKYPQIILPAAQKPEPIITNCSNSNNTTLLVTTASIQQPKTPPPAPPPPPPPPPPQTTAVSAPSPSPPSNVRVLTKLEDMKVSDLKMELKKRNLPVSGPKPQLIERLKPFTGTTHHMTESGAVVTTTLSSGGRTISVSSLDNPPSVISEMDLGDEENQNSPNSVFNASPPPPSPAHSAMDTTDTSPPTSPQNGDTIIELQQRKIEELQRELQRSQQQLQQIQQKTTTTTSTTATITKANSTQQQQQQQPIPLKAVLQNGILHIDPKTQQKLVLQQHLQNKIQQQQQQVETANAKASLAAFLNQQQQLNNLLQQAAQQSGTVDAKASLAAFLNQQQTQQQLNNIIQQANTNNKTNGRRSIVLGQQQAAIVLNHLNLVKQKNNQPQRAASLPSFVGVVQTKAEEKPTTIQVPAKVVLKAASPPPPPPAATVTPKVEEKQPKKNVKSQIVDDVLEILIKNGELPPSAANDPATPTTPGRYDEKGLDYPPPPPPPPPPPLPQPGFAVTLPTSIPISAQSQYPNTTFSNSPSCSQNYFNNSNSQFYNSNFLENSEFDLDNLLTSSNVPSEYSNSNLKELGLDLETLDSMDFSHLDGRLDQDENMDRSNDHLINNNLQLKSELMDMNDVPMDMDDADWLDSLMPPTNQNQRSSSNNNLFDYNHDSSYDPLLSNANGSFDLFNIDDHDFKLTNDITNSLNWDKVDFAT